MRLVQLSEIRQSWSGGLQVMLLLRQPILSMSASDRQASNTTIDGSLFVDNNGREWVNGHKQRVNPRQLWTSGAFSALNHTSAAHGVSLVHTTQFLLLSLLIYFKRDITAQIAKFMGPTWGLSAPDGSHVGCMNFAIWVVQQQWKCITLHNMIGICPNHILNPSVCLHMSKYLMVQS